MLSVIRKLLEQVISNIDSGNSNISKEESAEIIDLLKKYTDRDTPISKYTACEYLNISRASFDNHVRDGKLPKGKKLAGFKELMWYKKDLDEYIKQLNSRNYGR